MGLAQQEGALNIHNPTSEYLGKGWTSLPEGKENQITVWHQLTMTSGLNDSNNADCTDPDCLTFSADAGTRWAYHNAPYTLLDKVVQNATGQNLNIFGSQRLFSKTGMTGLFVKIGYNNVFFSKPRVMARFGSLILNQGTWNGNEILTDKNFLNATLNTSQELNLSYGYLWWLNGKTSAMLPGSQIVFNRPLFLNAPEDMISALGKNGQIINIVPSQNLVMVRMGNFSQNTPVPFFIIDEIWERFNDIQCTTGIENISKNQTSVKIYPNPGSAQITFTSDIPIQKVDLINLHGEKLNFWSNAEGQHSFSTTLCDPCHGFYLLEITLTNGQTIRKKQFFVP